MSRLENAIVSSLTEIHKRDDGVRRMFVIGADGLTLSPLFEQGLVVEIGSPVTAVWRRDEEPSLSPA